ncbi:MAG: RagB/SusD family nutrient uptake outer membrane protein [Flammeovirgaceae bacterium]|nr:RagB/SusD family nutrient uptake outer membrane protein [Flammeovirgaceae bacterium]
MKKIFKLLLPGLCLFLLSNCTQEDDLEISPPNQIDFENFITDQHTANQGLNSVYAALNDVAFKDHSLQMVCDFPALSVSDNKSDEFGKELDEYTWNAQNEALNNVWNALVEGIERANVVINKIPELSENEIDLEQSERIVLEARFLRGYYYFMLKGLFDKVPLFETNIASHSDNSSNVGTDEEVWELIINDLIAAEKLPAYFGDSEKFRATKGASKAMLGQVYMHRSGTGIANEWSLAAKKFSQVINSGRYIMMENYADLFESTNSNNYETVFALFPNNEKATLGSLGQPYDHHKGTMLWFSNPSFESLFDQNDSRKSMLFSENTSGGNSPNVFQKYGHEELNKSPLYTIRLADVWLMYSEAINEMDGADRSRLTGINLVRARAGLSPIKNNKTQEQFREILMVEREKELCLEQKSVFDYRRFGLEKMQWITKKSGATLHIESKHLVYPIPQPVIDEYTISAKSWEQNPGY